MTEEVDFLINRIREEYGAGALSAGTTAAGSEPPLEIYDRADIAKEDGERDVTRELSKANIITVASVDEVTTAIGTEYDHDLEHVANVRVLGMTRAGGEWGHVDPDGSNGAPWPSLVRFVRRAILRARTFPGPGRPNVGYTDLQLTNQSPQSDNFGDFYRWETDVIFNGFESLP